MSFEAMLKDLVAAKKVSPDFLNIQASAFQKMEKFVLAQLDSAELFQRIDEEYKLKLSQIS